MSQVTEQLGFKFWPGQADKEGIITPVVRGSRHMQTLIVLSIGITLALGCFALGYGIFGLSADIAKPQKTSPVRDEQ